MPWDNSPAARRRSDAVYGPEWRRVREKALERDNRRCVQCGSRRRLEVDHIVAVSQGGTHSLSNLRTLCETCHGQVTAQQGGGGRGRKAAADPAPRPSTVW